MLGSKAESLQEKVIFLTASLIWMDIIGYKMSNDGRKQKQEQKVTEKPTAQKWSTTKVERNGQQKKGSTEKSTKMVSRKDEKKRLTEKVNRKDQQN